MALPSNEYLSGGGGSSQKPSPYHRYNIDQGTELFRKKLEEHAKTKNERIAGKNSVQGGIPPHLLRQSNYDNPESNSESSGAPAQLRDPGHQDFQTTPQHTRDYHSHACSSEPSQNYQSQSRPSEMAIAEARGPPQSYSSASNDPAPSVQPIIRQQQSRTRPGPTPPLNTHNSPAGWVRCFPNKATSLRQQQHTPTPTHGGNGRGKPRQDNMVFIKAIDAPATHPALRNIMSSRWRKEVHISDNAPGQQSLTHLPEISTPLQNWSTPARNGRVHLLDIPYQDQHSQTKNTIQQPPVNQFQSMALVQQAQVSVQPEKKKWRPKHSVDLESQSLPASVSSFRFTDDNISARDIDNDEHVAGNTINLSKIAASLNLAPKRNGKGFPEKIEHCPQDYQTEGDEETLAQNLRPSHCRDWVASLPDKQPPVAWGIHKNVERNEECDVEPRNGYFMAPVDYPPTHINPKDKEQHGSMSRRLINSSKLRSAIDFEKNKRRLENWEKKSREQEFGDPESHWRPVADPFPAPRPVPRPIQPVVGNVQAYSGLQREAGTNIRTAVQARVNDSVSRTLVEPVTQQNNQGWESYVKTPCFMRPAQPDDLPQVLDIYNWEVIRGIQALDTMPLCLQDIQNVFSQCKSAQTPFIVMIAGTPAEAAVRKETPAPFRGPYQPYPQGPYQQSQKTEQDKVLGFGFINILTTGLAGDVNHNVGRFQGRAYFYVASETRRKGIGRALMTRLAQCCSIYTVSMGEYEWHDPDKTPACDTVGFNARNYSRLFIETASRGKTDPDTIWLAKLLDSEHFFCVCTMDKARKVGGDNNGLWLDNLVWQLDCQDPKSMRENVKK